MFAEQLTELSILQYELDRQVAQFKALRKKEARFGAELPEDVMDVAQAIYSDEIDVSIEGMISNAANAIIKFIKKIFRAIIDTVEKMHAYFIRKQNEFSKNRRVNLHKDISERAKEELKNYTDILPPERFYAYLVAINALVKEFNSNNILIAHNNENLDTTYANQALNAFGFGFGPILSVYPVNNRGKRIGIAETPEGFKNRIDKLLKVKAQPGQWEIDTVQHYHGVYERIGMDGYIDGKQMRKNLDTYMRQIERDIKNDDVDKNAALEAQAAASKWYLSLVMFTVTVSKTLADQLTAVATLANKE